MGDEVKSGAIGIDLGTSNSAAAVALSADNAILVESVYGRSRYGKSFPSYVYFDRAGNVQSVGIPAQREMHINPERVVWGVKRLVGLTYAEAKERGELERLQYPVEEGPDGGILIKAGAKSMSPSEVLSIILRHIKEQAEDPVNACIGGIRFDRCVVSIPAKFNAARANHVIRAAEEAGFKDVRTIAEPTAAAVTYCLKVGAEEAKILVFDMGAGTTDMTLLQLLPDKALPLPGEFAIAGDECLGGADMDDSIVQYVMEKHPSWGDANDPMHRAMLRDSVEWAKIKLSRRTDAALQLPSGEFADLRRSDLEEIIASLLRRCREVVKGSLARFADSGVSAREIDHVVFVGGPCHMPCIRALVAEELRAAGARAEVLDGIAGLARTGFPVDPMECVARGAALKAAGIIEPVITCLAHGYGIVFGPVKNQPSYYSGIIEESALYPVKGSAGVRCVNRESRILKIPIVMKDPSPSARRPYSLLKWFPLFISPTGECPSVAVTVSIDDNRGMTLRLVHEQTKHSVEFKACGILEGRQMYLQEHTRPSWSEPEQMVMPPAWTGYQREQLLCAAAEALESIGDAADAPVKKAVMSLVAEVKQLSDGGGELNTDCPNAANRIAELYDSLLCAGTIEEKDYHERLERLAAIAES